MDTNWPPKPDDVEVIVEEDLLVARVRRDYDLEVERYFQTICSSMTSRFGYRLLLLDMTHAGPLKAEAREEMARWSRSTTRRGAVAIMGASFTIRTLAKMVIAAIRNLTTREVHLDFFHEEVEARAWLAAQRPHLQAMVKDADS